MRPALPGDVPRGYAFSSITSLTAHFSTLVILVNLGRNASAPHWLNKPEYFLHGISFRAGGLIEAVGSLILGAAVEGTQYKNLQTVTRGKTPSEKLLKALSSSERLETYLVNEYLDPDMYYLGKLLVDLLEESASGTIADMADSIHGPLREGIKNVGKITGIGAAASIAAGGAGAVPSGGGTLAAGTTAAGVITIAGVGTITVLGAANAVGSIVSAVNGDINSQSRTNAEENSQKIKDSKGDSEADIPDYKKENRVPLDKETVLKGKDYQKTSKKVKGAQVYKKGDQYYYRDTFHTGESAHLEVFDKWGKHLGEADPLTGILKPGTADPTKIINVK